MPENNDSGDEDTPEAVEVLPSGRRVPVSEMEVEGPESDYIINTQNPDDLTMYAFEFGKQSVESEAYFSGWDLPLDYDELVENPDPIIEAIYAIQESRTAHDWSKVEGRPREVRRYALTFAQYVLSRVIIQARLTGNINKLPGRSLEVLPKTVDNPGAGTLLLTVCLAHTHSEFPKNLALNNEFMYIPKTPYYPYDMIPLATVWFISEELFYEGAERVLHSEGDVVPPWEAHEILDREKWLQSVVSDIAIGCIKPGNNPLPIVFSGDPEGELTNEVAPTLPERTKEDYIDVIDWAIDIHPDEFTREQFLDVSRIAPEDVEKILS